MKPAMTCCTCQRTDLLAAEIESLLGKNSSPEWGESIALEAVDYYGSHQRGGWHPDSVVDHFHLLGERREAIARPVPAKISAHAARRGDEERPPTRARTVTSSPQDAACTTAIVVRVNSQTQAKGRKNGCARQCALAIPDRGFKRGADSPFIPLGRGERPAHRIQPAERHLFGLLKCDSGPTCADYWRPRHGQYDRSRKAPWLGPSAVISLGLRSVSRSCAWRDLSQNACGSPPEL